MNSCLALLHELQCKQWLGEITRKPQLREYVTFKNSYEVEPYALLFMKRKHRSYLAKYRCGILPLSIETGRWGGIPLEDIICNMCDSLVVEDEYHFIFHYITISETHLYKMLVIQSYILMKRMK